MNQCSCHKGKHPILLIGHDKHWRGYHYVDVLASQLEGHQIKHCHHADANHTKTDQLQAERKEAHLAIEYASSI